jgi:hypothetical protein
MATPRKRPEDLLKRGRPKTPFKDEYCDFVIQLGKEGKSYAQIALALDISKPTLYLWMEQYPNFFDAMERARLYAEAWFEDQMQSGLWSKEFNGVLWGKAVSVRFRDSYGDKSSIELSGEVTTKVLSFRESAQNAED